MTITLRRAMVGDKPAIANLIQLYLHDMTEFMPFPVGPDGRFAYDFLDRFWRCPYFIMSGDEIAGFALVVDECPLTGRAPCWFMAEFFVLKAYRGRGASARLH
ncbi:GNAT family N-acetyltransferase [Devosia sp. CAU 1758]